MKTAILVVGAGPSGLVLPNLLAANSASRRAFGIDDGSPMVPSYQGPVPHSAGWVRGGDGREGPNFKLEAMRRYREP